MSKVGTLVNFAMDLEAGIDVYALAQRFLPMLEQGFVDIQNVLAILPRKKDRCIPSPAGIISQIFDLRAG